MSRWFRFYDEVLHDPKVQSLTGDQFKVWVNLLCIASKHDKGVLPDVTEIAFHLRYTIDQTSEQIVTFLALELLDKVGDKITPHNWKVRQYHSDSSATRTRRYRRKLKQEMKRHGDVTVTPPDTDTDTDTDTEKNTPLLVPPPTTARAPRSRTAGPRPLPPEWAPSEAHLALGRELGVDVRAAAAAMREWAAAENKRGHDWDARFRLWLRRERPPPRNGGGGKPLSPNAQRWRDAKEAMNETLRAYRTENSGGGDEPALGLLPSPAKRNAGP